MKLSLYYETSVGLSIRTGNPASLKIILCVTDTVPESLLSIDHLEKLRAGTASTPDVDSGTATAAAAQGEPMTHARQLRGNVER